MSDSDGGVSDEVRLYVEEKCGRHNYFHYVFVVVVFLFMFAISASHIVFVNGVESELGVSAENIFDEGYDVAESQGEYDSFVFEDLPLIFTILILCVYLLELYLHFRRKWRIREGLEGGGDDGG